MHVSFTLKSEAEITYYHPPEQQLVWINIWQDVSEGLTITLKNVQAVDDLIAMLQQGREDLIRQGEEERSC